MRFCDADKTIDCYHHSYTLCRGIGPDCVIIFDLLPSSFFDALKNGHVGDVNIESSIEPLFLNVIVSLLEMKNGPQTININFKSLL